MFFFYELYKQEFACFSSISNDASEKRCKYITEGNMILSR